MTRLHTNRAIHRRSGFLIRSRRFTFTHARPETRRSALGAKKGHLLLALASLSQRGSSLRRRLEQYRVAFAERNVALLLVSGLISEIGDWFNIVALLSLSYHISDSALGAGGVLAARMLT